MAPQFLNFILGRFRNKVMLAITALLAIGIGSVVYISTTLGLRDSQQSAYAAAAEVSKSLVTQFEQEVKSALDRSRSWAVLAKDSSDLGQLLQDDVSIVGIQLVNMLQGQVEKSGFANLGSDTRLQSSDISLSGDFLTRLRAIPLNDPSLVPALFEKSQIDKKVFFRIATPLTVEDGVFQKALVTWINPVAFKESFSQAGVFEKFMFLGNGDILVRSVVSTEDPNRVPVESKWNESFLKQVPKLDSKLSNAQVQLAGQGKRWSFEGFIGHTYKSRIPNLYVAVLSSESSLLETILAVARRSAYLGLAILSLSLVIGVVFADSVVKPLLSLVDVANRISEGKFDIHLKPQSRDEIATLTNAFNHMAQGLAERERIKEVFGKFHSKAVFQKLLVEDRIRLGGERVPVTVFFSDIRSFTNTSETMAPEQVVEFLNEYMSEMVAVIERHGGVVDKYVGDAIMAIWGLPVPNPSVDAENAVRACLEMRERLVLLNERRAQRGQKPIQIGMGLNSGEVVAGNIGSPSRMEYTVIGDTVNTASRMESLTKEMGTDFLINESTVALLPRKEIFAFDGPFETKVKGKAEKALVYGCTTEIFIAHFNPPPSPRAA